MKKLKTYKQLFENKSLPALKETLEKIINDEQLPSVILNHITGDLEDIKIGIEDDIITFKVDYDVIDDLLDISRGTTYSIERIDWYDYEYYVDESEIEYIGEYLTDKQKEKLINFAKYVNYEKTNYEDDNFFYNLIIDFNLDLIKSDFIGEMMSIKQTAIKKKKYEEIDNETPFIINNHDNIELSYKKSLDFIKKHNLENIKTLTELFKKIGELLPYHVEFEYDIYDYEDYSNMKSTLDSSIKMIWDDEIGILKSYYIRDLIHSYSDDINNISILKKIFDKINWEDKENFNMYGYKYYFEMVSSKDREIYKWFISDDFNNRLKKYIKDNNIDESDDMVKTYRKMRKKEKVKQFKI